MTLPARVAANRRNAQLATGPRTTKGKAVSRFNAVTHGLTSRDPVLPFENAEDFAAILAKLRGELRVEGALEELLLVRITSHLWRLARVLKIETGILSIGLEEACSDTGDSHGKAGSDFENLLRRLRPQRLDSPAVLEAGPTRSLSSGEANASRLGRAFINDAAGPDALSKLSRYEARLDRALSRDLMELQRLQSFRAS